MAVHVRTMLVASTVMLASSKLLAAVCPTTIDVVLLEEIDVVVVRTQLIAVDVVVPLYVPSLLLFAIPDDAKDFTPTILTLLGAIQSQ